MTFCKESVLEKNNNQKNFFASKIHVKDTYFFLNQTLPLPKSTYIQQEVSNLHSKDFV